MNNVAPTSFCVCSMDEFDEALAFRGHLGLGRRSAKHRMPGSTFFSWIDDAAFQQAASVCLEIARFQQCDGGILKVG